METVLLLIYLSFFGVITNEVINRSDAPEYYGVTYTEQRPAGLCLYCGIKIR